MRLIVPVAMVLMAVGCSRGAKNEASAASAPAPAGAVAQQEIAQPVKVSGGYLGFDRNEYPGDDTMAAMKAKFSWVGYWLTVPPGAEFNQWVGKRDLLRKQGWGFLLLADGKLEKEILAAQKSGTPPDALGRKDAAVAVAAAKSEGFPAHAILFLDQEEGGRLTDVQAKYLLAWTEAVATSAYRAGVYASGQPATDDENITTVNDIRNRVKVGHLHEVEIFDTQDACGPSNGCSMTPRPLSEAGEANLNSWQYSQSPRRPEITKSCAKTYATDGKCYAPGFPGVFLDLDLAASADPSAGR
jgi:hypothetical protein